MTDDVFTNHFEERRSERRNRLDQLYSVEIDLGRSLPVYQLKLRGDIPKLKDFIGNIKVLDGIYVEATLFDSEGAKILFLANEAGFERLASFLSEIEGEGLKDSSVEPVIHMPIFRKSLTQK